MAVHSGSLNRVLAEDNNWKVKINLCWEQRKEICLSFQNGRGLRNARLPFAAPRPLFPPLSCPRFSPLFPASFAAQEIPPASKGSLSGSLSDAPGKRVQIRSLDIAIQAFEPFFTFKRPPRPTAAGLGGSGPPVLSRRAALGLSVLAQNMAVSNC